MKKRIININQIAKTLGVQPKDIVNTIKEITVTGERTGYIDSSEMLFYQFTEKEFQNLITKYNNSKFTLSEGKVILSL